MGTAKLINLNDANISTMPVRADKDFKIWLHRNDAAPGFVVDSSVSDKVLAIKGGSDAYDVNGGNTGGDFDHNHQWLNWIADGSNTQSYDSSGGDKILNGEGPTSGAISHLILSSANGSDIQVSDQWTSAPVANKRPAAAVGTLQKPGF